MRLIIGGMLMAMVFGCAGGERKEAEKAWYEDESVYYDNIEKCIDFWRAEIYLFSDAGARDSRSLAELRRFILHDKSSRFSSWIREAWRRQKNQSGGRLVDASADLEVPSEEFSRLIVLMEDVLAEDPSVPRACQYGWVSSAIGDYFVRDTARSTKPWIPVEFQRNGRWTSPGGERWLLHWVLLGRVDGAVGEGDVQ